MECGPPREAALTAALRSAGLGYYQFRQEFGSKSVPTSLRASSATWETIDALAQECDRMDFAAVVGRQWWPQDKPPRRPERITDEAVEAGEFAVA